VQSPLYVEARGYLQPAVDFLSRAVAAAERSDSLTGDLLATVGLRNRAGSADLLLTNPKLGCRSLHELRQRVHASGWRTTFHACSTIPATSPSYSRLFAVRLSSTVCNFFFANNHMLTYYSRYLDDYGRYVPL